MHQLLGASGILTEALCKLAASNTCRAAARRRPVLHSMLRQGYAQTIGPPVTAHLRLVVTAPATTQVRRGSAWMASARKNMAAVHSSTTAGCTLHSNDTTHISTSCRLSPVCGSLQHLQNFVQYCGGIPCRAGLDRCGDPMSGRARQVQEPPGQPDLIEVR